MLEYVTDTLKTSRLKKVDTIDIWPLRTRRARCCRQVGSPRARRSIDSWGKAHDATGCEASRGTRTRYRHACARLSDAAVLCDASVLELHKTPAVVDNVNTKSDRQV